MPIKNGDFVLVDYSLKVKDTNEVFDVTMEDQAKAANVYSPEQAYEPKLIVVGQGWMIKGIDEALLEADEGQEKDLEIPPAKAFGERDGSKVRIVPARELTKQGVTPRPGARIEVGGQLATIRSVGSGRVIVDYNHPLAGKTLVTKLYIRKVVSDPVERMRELIHRRIVNVKKDKFMISNLGTMVTVEMPEESFTLEDIQFAKKGIAKEIGKYFPEVTTVQFIESHVLKQPEKVEAKPEEKKAELAKEEAKPAGKEEAKLAAKEETKETEKPAAKEGGRSRKKAQQRAQ
ncbi:MAG: FKBP-type peptidyl-prolyl cis-trans isomerase [Candidatus Methanomethylicaceae archaeon]|jgi:peptidylprolyl isomerase